MQYVADPWVSLTVCAAVIVGGLGFPVIFELRRAWRRPRTWSVLTRITLAMTVVLLAVGTLVITTAEYTGPRTLGPLSAGEKWLAGFFASTNARTAGFNTMDVSAQGSESLLMTDILMFIGGGSAGTAGGIKVTTFGLLAYVIWAEMRGEPDVTAGRRSIPGANQRQALSIALMSIGVVILSTFALLGLSSFSLEKVLFEAISAFATVGLSTGITAGLPSGGQVLLIVLMFVGRVGPLTLASALALRLRTRRYELPEERTIVG
jgi:trk system potassium uptake protein